LARDAAIDGTIRSRRGSVEHAPPLAALSATSSSCAARRRSKTLVDVWGPQGDRGRLLASMKRALRSERRAERRARTVVTAFDSVHPPDARADRQVRALRLLPAVVPHLSSWGEEMDSPRGRIYLMEAGSTTRGDGARVRPPLRRLPRLHGVRHRVPVGRAVSPLIEATRGQIERRYPRAFGDPPVPRAIFSLFPFPGRLRIALAPLVVGGRGVVRALRRSAGASERRNVPTTRGMDARRAASVQEPTFDDAGAATRRREAAKRAGTASSPRLRAMLALAPR
jgi:hypothetical protein